jgi:hypothetical protein
MAVFITAPSEGDSSTSGERHFAKAIKRCLGDEYIVWYDVPVGLKVIGNPSRQPDFILLHPQWGVLIMEIKDWRMKTIQDLNPKQATLLVNGQPTEAKNPLNQARDYGFRVMNLLQKDHLLVHPRGKHEGKLLTPCNHGVVLSNIKRRDFEAKNFSTVIPPHLVICQDEMNDSVSPEAFEKRLLDMCEYSFGSTLANEQIDRIRWHLFPEIRINAPSQLDKIPDIIQIMDLEQEKLARNLGDGHRIIHGVAGSGKTLVLVNRCLQLIEELDKPILVICFNLVLAAQLRYVLQEKGAEGRVIVQHFHGWCKHILKQSCVSSPRRADYAELQEYIHAIENTVLEAVENGQILQGIYGAVLVDEAHDFNDSWLKLLAKMPDPDKKHLLILYDDAQGLYSRQRPIWSRLNIQARGRTSAMKVNYRNTIEVATWASLFAQDMLAETSNPDEDQPIRLTPQTAGRIGIAPKIRPQSNFREEVKYIATGLKKLHEEGYAWNQMAILYAFKRDGGTVAEILASKGVPVEWLNEQNDRLNYNPAAPSVKVMTIHCSKGLEFPVVAIPGIDKIDNYDEKVQLIYVGMTRSTNKLVLSYTGSNCNSALVQHLETTLPSLAA